jgi:hypothetical protein
LDFSDRPGVQEERFIDGGFRRDVLGTRWFGHLIEGRGKIQHPKRYYSGD